MFVQMNFVSLLKFANVGVSFDQENQHLVLLDERLLKAIRLFHHELEGNELKRDGELVTVLPHHEVEGTLYFDFSHVNIDLDMWLRVIGYQNIITCEYHMASEKDMELRRDEDGFPLVGWVAVYFESDMKRIHFIGVDEYGNIGEEIQVPFETVGHPDYEATWEMYKEWIDDIRVSLYDNVLMEDDR